MERSDLWEVLWYRSHTSGEWKCMAAEDTQGRETEKGRGCAQKKFIRKTLNSVERSEVKNTEARRDLSSLLLLKKAWRNACGLPAGTHSYSCCSQSKVSHLLSGVLQPLYTSIYIQLSSLRGPELNTIFQAASSRHENMLEK